MINYRYIFLFITFFIYRFTWGQSEITAEQYHVAGDQLPYTYMPVVHYQNSRNWYAEARYNYEDMNTFSLFLGKTFSGGRNLSYSFTPLIGGSLGRFKGVSAGLNIDMEYNQCFFSAQSQYSLSTDKYYGSFIYNWSEIGYQGLSWLYGGISLQQTYERSFESPARFTFEPGVLAGFTFHNFTIPVYLFKPFNAGRYFIVGINYTWQRQKPSRKPSPTIDEKPPVIQY